MKKLTDWAPRQEVLGLTLDTEAMAISLPLRKLCELQERLEECPATRETEMVREVLVLAGKLHHAAFCGKARAVKSGSKKMRASMVRRWLHELEPVNPLENREPPRLLCLFPTNPKPEDIRCRRNTGRMNGTDTSIIARLACGLFYPRFHNFPMTNAGGWTQGRYSTPRPHCRFGQT